MPPKTYDAVQSALAAAEAPPAQSSFKTPFVWDAGEHVKVSLMAASLAKQCEVQLDTSLTDVVCERDSISLRFKSLHAPGKFRIPLFGKIALVAEEIVASQGLKVRNR